MGNRVKRQEKVMSIQQFAAAKLSARPMDLGTMDLPDFDIEVGEIQLPDFEALERLQLWGVEQHTKIVGGVRKIAEALADERHASRVLQQILEQLAKVRAFIARCPSEADRLDLEVAFVKAMAEHFPATLIGVGLAAHYAEDYGLLIGARDNTSPGQRAPFPTCGEDGQIRYHTLMPGSIPGSKGVFPLLRLKAQEVRDADAADFSAGSGSLAEAVVKNDGSIEVVLWIKREAYKDRDGREKTKAGGHVKVVIEKGFVRPIAAQGGCSRFVEQIIPLNIGYQVAALLDESKLEAPRGVDRTAFFVTADILRRGLKAEGAGELIGDDAEQKS